MPTTIGDLPDLCLLTIFDKCELMQLPSTVFLTCTRWAGLRRSIYARRRSICITIVEDDNVNKDAYRLNPIVNLFSNALTESQVNWLVRNFPNINDLKINVLTSEPDELTVDCVTSLLSRWADKLQKFYFDYFSFETFQVFPSINSLTKLEHLKLSGVLPPRTIPQLELPVLSQLKYLRFHSNCDTLSFCSWIKRNYGGNTELEIGFSDDEDSALSPEEANAIYTIGGPFLHQFLQFTPLHNSTFEEYHLFCSRFRGLTSVEMVEDSLSLKQITQCLALLPKLKHLYLWPCNDINLYCSDESSGQFMPLPKVDRLHLSLKRQTLNEHELSHKRLPYSKIFPNLKQLCINFFMIRNVQLDQAMPFARAFKDCPKLEQIEIEISPYDKNPHTFTLDQLFTE